MPNRARPRTVHRVEVVGRWRAERQAQRSLRTRMTVPTTKMANGMESESASACERPTARAPLLLSNYDGSGDAEDAGEAASVAPLVRTRSASGFTWEAMAAGKLSQGSRSFSTLAWFGRHMVAVHCVGCALVAAICATRELAHSSVHVPYVCWCIPNISSSILPPARRWQLRRRVEARHA